MYELFQALEIAFKLIVSLDSNVIEIVFLSLKVTLFALVISCFLGLPIGCLIATNDFIGKNIILVLINTLMALPPVIVGLFVYMFFSKSGPLGWLEILYTPKAMILAQTIIITPIILALSRQIFEDFFQEYKDFFISISLSKFKILSTIIWDARFSIITVALAGFGRGISEVGAVIIVGGNINHFTRVITTSIALETSMGNLPFAMALGLILLIIAICINFFLMSLKITAKKNEY